MVILTKRFLSNIYMLIYLLVIVILLRFLRKEGLTTYDISGGSNCIYTQVPPQVEKIYNIDFDSPFDRYDTLNINSKYNVSYYDDTSFNINLDIKKNQANNIFPFFKAYRYCDLSNNEPTCVVETCDESDISHNKGVAELMSKQRTLAKNKAITELNNQRSTLSKQYNANVNKVNKDYFDKL